MKRLLVSVALVLALPVLSGCSSDHSGHESAVSAAVYTSGELMFAQMMIPHHKQAVEMSVLAPTHTDNDEILGLAAEIKLAQQPEIDQMTAWITSSGSAVETHHDMAMDGMLTDAEMASLASASGAEFDKLYLSGMIKHHQGAIDMLSMISSSTTAEVVALRESIRKTQTAEIKQMQDLLKKY